MSDIYIVQRCHNIRDCQEFMHNFFETHREEVKRVNKRYPIEIVLKTEEHIFVMTYKQYETWCLGRTYKFYDDNESIYHSGFRIREGDEE